MPVKYQKYVDLPDGKMIGIHILTPIAAAGTESIVVAEMAKYSIATPADAVKQVAKYGQTALGTAPLAADAYTVTMTWTAAEIAAAANDEVVVVTNHRIRKGNFQAEDTTPYSL